MTRIVAILVVCLSANTAAAVQDGWDPSWAAIEVSGDVRTIGQGSTDGEWIPIEPLTLLPIGSPVRTGPDGFAVLVQDFNTIRMGPGTELTLPSPRSPNDMSEVLQDSGTARYEVDRRPTASFTVRTPLVVTLVRGTQFDVVVAEEAVAVVVNEGLVTVAETDGSSAIDIPAGHTVSTQVRGPGTPPGESPFLIEDNDPTIDLFGPSPTE